MAVGTRLLVKGAVWTTGAYGVNQTIRLLTNVVLARLLSPELFGIMLIVYSLRTGIELLSDVGIEQNIVYNSKAEEPEFYNTAWSLQLLRSIVLWIVFLAAAAPMAHFYGSSILVYVMPVAAFSFLMTGLTSVRKPLLQKRMMIGRLSAYETVNSIASSIAHITLASISKTVWALVFGSLTGSAAAMIGSYFLLSGIKQRFYISKKYAWEILHFGKWIFLSSMVYFLSTYIDRLYLGRLVPMEIVGIYGIARSISDLSGNLVVRLGGVVLFPYIASQSKLPREELRQQLSGIRARFLFIAAFGIAVFAATADLAIRILYDARYQDATWILPILVIGSWFTVLATVNESTLLGIGKPAYNAVSNSLKLVFLIVGLTLGVKIYGLLGGVVVVALADLARYVPILIGQIRERFSFALQDFGMTLAAFASMAILEWVRWRLGFGTSLDTLPLPASWHWRG
jgi:O-antigen/teichoic acid export membrane protein